MSIKTLTLTFCTRYNGVDITPTEHDFDEHGDEFYHLCTQLSDAIEDFPSMTYEMVDKFDHYLTDDQEEQLIELAKQRVKPLIGDVEIVFEYDNHST